MSDKPKILCVRGRENGSPALPPDLLEKYEVVEVQSSLRALARLTREHYAGMFVMSDHLQDVLQIGRLLQNDRILDGMPDGVALLDMENVIIWSNQQLRRWSNREEIVGQNFYAALGSPEILGPDFCPFHTALATGQASGSTLKADENRYFHVHAAPVLEEGEAPRHLIVTVRDVTEEILQQQKLAAIHKAGIELADLTPEEVFQMSVEDRIELLKANILHYTKDLLNFDVVEIRLLTKPGASCSPCWRSEWTRLPPTAPSTPDPKRTA